MTCWQGAGHDGVVNEERLLRRRGAAGRGRRDGAAGRTRGGLSTRRWVPSGRRSLRVRGLARGILVRRSSRCLGSSRTAPSGTLVGGGGKALGACCAGDR